MLSFHQVVQADFEAVNDTIVSQLHSDVALVENIGHYIVDAGGKRLRPLLVLLFANAHTFTNNGYNAKDHINLAAIIEFIHTATLLHDDVVDMSSLRRGRPTANAKWGNSPSVLVGDFLYSRAFQMMVEIGSMPIMSILSNTTNVIAEGEVQQLVNARDPEVTEENYLQVIHKKTAVLFEAAAQCASVIAGVDENAQEQARLYGYHIGVAFQLVDDILDYSGNASEMGKNVGDDLAEGKATLPLIYTMKHGETQAANLIRDAITESKSDSLDAIITAVQNSGGIEYTSKLAQEHAASAKATLASLNDSPFKRALEELADFAVQRTF